MVVTRDATTAKDALPQTGSRQAMPTLVACGVACLALVTAVGLQAPAVSVGLRWKPGPRRTREIIPIEPLDFPWPPSDSQPDNGSPAWLAWLLAALAFLALLWIARWIHRRTRRPPPMNIARLGADSGVLSEANAQILQSGLAAAIEILSAEHRDPGNAVVQAWQGLQDAAAAAGLQRRPAETASEFTARILYRSRRSAQPIAVLLTLYQRVRFGEHSPHADEIAAARHSLETIVGLWEADFPKRRPTAGAR